MSTKWRLIICLGILGVVLTYLGAKDWIVLSKPAKDITELWDVDYSDLKAGDHVCFDITLVWDQIGSQVTEKKTFGVTTSETESARYYLLPFCRDYEDGYLYPTPYLLVKLGSKYNTTMDNQIAKTEAWWTSEGDYDDIPTTSIHLDGKLVKLPNDVRKQLSSTLDPGEVLEDFMIPVLYEDIAAPGAVKVMTIAGILCLMAFLAILFFVFKGAATAPAQPIPGVRKSSFASQGGDPGAVFAQQPQGGTTGSAFGQQPLSGGAGSAFGQQPQGGAAGSAFGQAGAAAGSAFAQAGAAAGSAFAQQGSNTGAFGQQSQGGAFGTQSTAAPQQPKTASPYSTATLETTQIPYIPGISLGPAPGALAQSGPSPMGPSSSGGSEPLGPSGGISGPSQLGPSPLGPSTIGGSEPAASEAKADETAEMTEEQAAQIAAMSFGSSQPAMLPLGGNATSVHATSQAATLPLGVSPTQVSSGNSFTMPPAQPESTTAPTTPPSPIYGSGPATPPSSIYGSGPATPPSPIYGTAPKAAPEKSAQPEEDENAPLYADNTQMKKVFQGAFANPTNNGKN